jgi:quercetin dioxygenase-like cupin family protein
MVEDIRGYSSVHPSTRAGDHMTTTAPPPLTIVRPGEGGAGELGSIGVDFKLWGRDTGGAVSVVEHPFPVGALVPPHLHTREDEYSIVTAGEIGFRSGDREVVLGAGGYITKPRGEMHAMWNAGPVPARMIEIISPAGFEHFFHELSELVADGPPATDSLMALADRYGLQFGQPDWLPGLVARFGLTTPGQPAGPEA